MNTAQRVCLLSCVTALLDACGGGGSGGSTPPPAPPPAPLTLSSSIPANNVTNVDRAIAPALTFSAALDSTTVTSNVVLRRGSQVVVTNTSVNGSTVTLTPQNTLTLLTPYTVTATTGLRGTLGGTLGSAATTSFTTRDGTWQTPQKIAHNNSDVAPQIGFDANGNALAVWQQSDGIRNNIWANRYTPSAVAGAPLC